MPVIVSSSSPARASSVRVSAPRRRNSGSGRFSACVPARSRDCLISGASPLSSSCSAFMLLVVMRCLAHKISDRLASAGNAVPQADHDPHATSTSRHLDISSYNKPTTVVDRTHRSP
jgi:hypothetical protein